MDGDRGYMQQPAGAQETREGCSVLFLFYHDMNVWVSAGGGEGRGDGGGVAVKGDAGGVGDWVALAGGWEGGGVDGGEGGWEREGVMPGKALFNSVFNRSLLTN